MPSIQVTIKETRFMVSPFVFRMICLSLKLRAGYQIHCFTGWDTSCNVPEGVSPGCALKRTNWVLYPPASAKSGKYSPEAGGGYAFVCGWSCRNKEVVSFVVPGAEADDSDGSKAGQLQHPPEWRQELLDARIFGSRTKTSDRFLEWKEFRSSPCLRPGFLFPQ